MAVWQKENDLDKAIKLILFLISPFLAFVYSLRRMKTKSSYVVFFLFAVFFGMAFTINLNSGFDSIRYVEQFEEYQHVTHLEFMNDFAGFLNFDEGKKDFYFDTVAFYTSRFTDNYHFLFMFFSIVFAFFMLKSFRFLTAEKKFNLSLASFILAYWFVNNDIFNINGVRFWTAAWIGIYAIFQIFQRNDKRYWLLVLVTPFFHGSLASR